MHRKPIIIVPGQPKSIFFEIFFKSLNIKKIKSPLILVCSVNLFNLNAKKYKLNKNYIYLGLIPYKDVMSLIYYSLAVINPSHFEGWSSTVEQAKGYNKKIILSNIKVHREQNPKNAFFFEPKNYLKLSKILIKLYSAKNKNFQAKYDKNLNNQLDKYIGKFCSVILTRDSRLI